MAQSRVLSFGDPDQMEAAHAFVTVQLTPTERTPFEAQATMVEFDNLYFRQVYERVPRIKHSVQTEDRAFFRFLAAPGPGLLASGTPLVYEGLLQHPLGHCYYERTTSDVCWAAISVPVETLVSTGIAVGGHDPVLPRDPLIILPSMGAMGAMKHLHAAVVTLAANAPDVLAVPEVSRGLEQSLLGTLIGCLSHPEVHESSWALRCHATIMRRFHNMLDSNLDRAIYMPEVCAAIRVPERTLRLCCQEHFGMGPKQFLLLRRMHQAHRALGSVTDGRTTVTEIATRFGFWHFGRFAGAYQSLFGETPSATLHRRLCQTRC